MLKSSLFTGLKRVPEVRGGVKRVAAFFSEFGYIHHAGSGFPARAVVGMAETTVVPWANTKSTKTILKGKRNNNLRTLPWLVCAVMLHLPGAVQ
jgi:hypothetical protein